MVHFDANTWARILAHPDTELDGPASSKKLAAFEAKHDFVFPRAHREFLLRANGGAIGYVRLFGVARGDGLDLDKEVSQLRQYIEGMADGPIFPFANEWGGSYFCYDLRKRVSAKGYPVLFWNHEYSEEPEWRPMLWSKFASDFVSFVKKVIRKK